ncbi:MAG: pentapeptide repeat-containing protein [Cyanobacteria bacterium P01_C01_bin.69]
MTTALNFSNQKLHNRSFKGQDLTGADFSGAELRGISFKEAILTDATFKGAIAHSKRLVIIGLIALLVLTGLNIGTTSIITAVILRPANIAHTGWEECLIVYMVMSLFAIVLFWKGPNVALIASTLFIFLGWIGFLAIESILLGGAEQVLYGDHHSFAEAVGTVGVSVWAGLLTNVFAGALLLASLRSKHGQLREVERLPHSRFWSLNRWEALLLLATLLSSLPGVLLLTGMLAKISTVVFSSVKYVAAVYTARQILAECPTFAQLRRAALAVTTFGGTSFRGAKLHRTSFVEARLSGTDFEQAELMHTNFHRAKGLDFARPGYTLLRDRNTRHLLTRHRAQGKSYRRADLQQAYLAYADLTDADLTGADLTGADLTGAWLERTNLSSVRALGTNFQSAHLTGACVEAWNIDVSTRLNAALCNHVYLCNGAQERRPNSGDFEPGEFAKLFQEVLHTVDLIFSNGLDFSAFLSTFKQVQADHEGTPLSIRSIENKGDGMVLVKVDTPETVDKAQIHAELSEGYAAALSALESRYQAELAAKDEQLDIYRQHQTELKELTKLLSPLPQSQPQPTRPVGKRVVLKVNSAPQRQGAVASTTAGVSVTLQIGVEGMAAHVEVDGELPRVDAIAARYHQWQKAYSQIIHCLDTTHTSRIQAPKAQITNVSFQEILTPCQQSAQQLEQEINHWLDSAEFRPVKEQLLEELQATDSIRFFWQTDDLLLRQLPLQVWNWFERYPKAELMVSEPTYRQLPAANQAPGEVRILSILGDSTGINTDVDQALLSALPNVKLTFLTEPTCQQVTDQLWDTPWDILFFAGHSEPAQQATDPGYIRLNAHSAASQESHLTLNDLKYGLRKATERGLKLAIFNTCDGLSLLQNLKDAPTPPIVVMRHPIPDQVAQIFLKNFLQSFSEGLPLHQAVREAREKLQGIEPHFPFATWLPVVCQNPASKPLTWQDLSLN